MLCTLLLFCSIVLYCICVYMCTVCSHVCLLGLYIYGDKYKCAHEEVNLIRGGRG